MMSLPSLSILPASATVPNKIWIEKEEAYGLADGSVEDMQITKALLTARLVVKNDLGLWFHTKAYVSAGTPTVYIPDETLSVLELVAPNGSITYIGNFAKEHDKLSVELAIDSLDCTVMNLLNIIITALHGGIVKPTNLASILQDVKSIQAVKDAGEALIPFPNSAAQVAKATLEAAGHLSKLISDEEQAKLLLKALEKVGVKNISLSVLKKILVFDTVYELLKIIRDVTVKIIQSPTKNAVISFEAISQPITTRININSIPSGANIFINGESKGKTPASVSIKLRTETPKEYKIKLTKEGYKDWEKTFILEPKEKKEINVKMAPIVDLGEIVYLNKEKNEIWIMNPDGRNKRKTISLPNNWVYFDKPTSKIAGESEIHGALTQGISVFCQDHSFICSPDGKTLAYVTKENRIHLVSIDGESQVTLPDSANNPCFFSDSMKLAYEIYLPKKGWIPCIRDLSTGSLTMLPMPEGIDTRYEEKGKFAFSPDGSKIAYIIFPSALEELVGGDLTVTVVKADGSGILGFLKGKHNQVSFVEDKKNNRLMLALGGLGVVEGTTCPVIYGVEIDEKGLHNQELGAERSVLLITPFGLANIYNYYPGRYIIRVLFSEKYYRLELPEGALDGFHRVAFSLSPDGKHIVYASNKGGNCDIYTFDLTTETEEKITTSIENEIEPLWIRTGEGEISELLRNLSEKLRSPTEIKSEKVFPEKEQLINVALGKAVSITTNGVEDSLSYAGNLPSDITDGNLDYKVASERIEDGCVGWNNDDYNETMVITITIDLQGTYNITKIRYNPGNCQRAETWNADIMESPFGRIPTNPGSSYRGVWTEQTGNITTSKVTIKLEKTRRSHDTSWLFIGEIEILGAPITKSDEQKIQKTLSGLKGEYFNLSQFYGKPSKFPEEPNLSRIDKTIDFNWERGRPDPTISSNYFGIRWTGLIYISASGIYKFKVWRDDGCRLWFDNKLVFDTWYEGDWNHWIDFEYHFGKTGWHPFKLEFYEIADGARITLEWRPPGEDSFEVIPSSCLGTSTEEIDSVVITMNGPEEKGISTGIILKPGTISQSFLYIR